MNTPCSNCKLKKDFKNNLLDHLESTLMSKRMEKRARSVKIIKTKTHLSVDYIPKLLFIESNTAKDMEYFKGNLDSKIREF